MQVSALQKDDGVDDYGPGPASDDPKSGPPRESKSVDGATGEGPEGGLVEAEEEPELAKTKFSDDRFAKLFPNRGASRTFQARNVAKPKPTLPSFIKSTQPYVKVEVRTTPAPRGGVRGRATNQATTRRPTSPSTTARPRRGNLPTQRQLSGRLTSPPPPRASPAGSNSASASTPSPAALAAARRLRQPNNGVARFQRNQVAAPNNFTIPALNPRRN